MRHWLALIVVYGKREYSMVEAGTRKTINRFRFIRGHENGPGAFLNPTTPPPDLEVVHFNPTLEKNTSVDPRPPLATMRQCPTRSASYIFDMGFDALQRTHLLAESSSPISIQRATMFLVAAFGSQRSHC